MEKVVPEASKKATSTGSAIGERPFLDDGRSISGGNLRIST